MLPPQLDQFCINWINKADAYGEQTLADHFDKFTSLYIAFNAIYMQVMIELKIAGEKIPIDYKDKRSATDYVAQYLKGKFYISQLLNDGISKENLESICTIIDQERFHIILEYGTPQRALDLDLLNYLRSTARQEKSKAILSLFYHIRCNLFHGQKGFEDRQIELLKPVNQLLRKTIEITHTKLNN